MPASTREEFVSAVKAEWLARQSRMTEADAKRLASEVDTGWWRNNRERILKAIGEA